MLDQFENRSSCHYKIWNICIFLHQERGRIDSKGSKDILQSFPRLVNLLSCKEHVTDINGISAQDYCVTLWVV